MSELQNQSGVQVQKHKAATLATRDWYLKTDANSRRPNTSIEPLVCGVAAFRAVGEAILAARESIEIAIWGFDPSLRLQKSAVRLGRNCSTIESDLESRRHCRPFSGGGLSGKNPRIGDLLLYKASQGVKVRLLIWNDPLARLIRVDEHLPESGPDGYGIDPPVYRAQWERRLQKKGFFPEDQFCTKLREHTDALLKTYGEVLEAYKDHHRTAFESLIKAREAKGKEGVANFLDEGLEYPAIDTLQAIEKQLLAHYSRGYFRMPFNLVPTDSPMSQIDDHYYNAEWFRMVHKKDSNLPKFMENIEVRYRGQNRAVDGSASPAMQRINVVASRLEYLAPKLNQNKYFQAVSKKMDGFFLWWSDGEILRPSSEGWGAGYRREFGDILVFLKSNDYTRLYGTREAISKKIGSVFRYPIEWLGNAIKSISKIEKLMVVVDRLSDQGVRSLAATYHQKTVLVDFERPERAVGFVMGHNMLKNYMDDPKHTMFGSAARYPEFEPWQDISSRVHGECLEDLAKNFLESWPDSPSACYISDAHRKELGNRVPGGTAQVLRTALNPGGYIPDRDPVSVESIYEDLALELEEICNLFEDLLGKTKTVFEKGKKVVQEKVRGNPTLEEKYKDVESVLENVARKAGEALDKGREGVGTARKRAEEKYRELEPALQNIARNAEKMIDRYAPADTGALPAVRGDDAMSIYRGYCHAISQCSRFLYTENQYFRHEELAERVVKRAAMHREKEGKTLYWFVVTNHPVSPGEAPNTAKTLELIGQHERLGKYVREPHDKKMMREKYEKQTKRLEQARKELKELEVIIAEGNTSWKDHLSFKDEAELQEKRLRKTEELKTEIKTLATKINTTEKKYPSIKNYGDDPKTVYEVEKASDAFKTVDMGDDGLKVLVGTLTACHSAKPCIYTPIYVHSKLLVVDDAFMSLGSANLNVRSMHVDSEINISTDADARAFELRKQLFMQHTWQDKETPEENFEHWQKIMDDNWYYRHKGEALKGFLTHFYDPETPVARPTD